MHPPCNLLYPRVGKQIGSGRVWVLSCTFGQRRAQTAWQRRCGPEYFRVRGLRVAVGIAAQNLVVANDIQK
jgi:hypothetical protein